MFLHFDTNNAQTRAVLRLVEFYEQNRDGRVTVSDLGARLDRPETSPWAGQILVQARDGRDTVLVAADGSELHLS